jgi:hypothetical protein
MAFSASSSLSSKKLDFDNRVLLTLIAPCLPVEKPDETTSEECAAGAGAAPALNASLALDEPRKK